MSIKTPSVGFIGQGFVGKSYADDFKKRGYSVTRYALEEPYRKNKDKIKECEVVFICVPTPTMSGGFDVSIVEDGLRFLRKGAIAVIKSTLIPGGTARLQKKFPNIIIVFSPEFLNTSTAAKDAAHPFANILGLPIKDAQHKKAARLIHRILPRAPFSLFCSSEEAEIYKYAHNVSGYMQVLTYNLMYDTAVYWGADSSAIQKALEKDPMVSNWYIRPVHKSGRGAGGPCFIKDFAAFAAQYDKFGQREGRALLKAAQKHNISLLTATKKDMKLLREVYGAQVSKRT